MSDSEEYFEEYEEELSDDNSDESGEIDQANELVISDSEDSNDSEESEEINEKTLKTKMIFPKSKNQAANNIKEVISVPSLKGIVLPKQVQLPKKPESKTGKSYSDQEISSIVQTMSGINVKNNKIDYDRLNINDFLQKETQESDRDFKMRKDFTLKIASIENLKIENSTIVVLGSMLTKKLRFGIKYDEKVESLISYILELLRK